ncbi:hypothetical protein C7212DRAFT_350190 [Tuber magnatum]|uniref:Uncharacterized protein n=1 Tax=Tuber magnatum TaxID=42249 RepID=A0A317T0K2_9PEZI|nr:hypothetical protein C7212DRAFT_350190 [Tuber magnatum]
MRYLLAAAPLVIPALGAAVATVDPPLDELLKGLIVSEESYAVHHHKGESFLTARVACNGCRAYAGSKDQNGSKYVPNMGLETDLIFDVRIPNDEPTTLKINDAGVIPFGPNLAIEAYQIPRQIETEHFLFDTAESEWKCLPIGYDLMLQSSREGPESTQKQVTVSFRATSVGNERNDAIPELEIVVDEDLATKKLTMKSVSVKKLAGPPLVWLDEPEEMKDLFPLFTLPPLLDAPAAFDDTTPVDVDIEVEMEKVPCGTDIRCILDHAIDNLRAIKDTVMGTKTPPAPPHHPCNHHNQEDPTLDGEFVSTLPIDLDFPDASRYENFGPLRTEEEEKPTLGFGFLNMLPKVMFPIFIGITAGVAVSLLGLILGQLFMLGWKRIRASRGTRCHYKRCNSSDEARVMLAIEEEEDLPEYRDEGIEVVEKE